MPMYNVVVLEVCVIRKIFNCNSWHTVCMGEPTGGLPQDTQQTLITTKSTYMQGTLARPCMHIHAHTHVQIHTRVDMDMDWTILVLNSDDSHSMDHRWVLTCTSSLGPSTRTIPLQQGQYITAGVLTVGRLC